MNYDLLTSLCLESGTQYEQDAELRDYCTMKTGGKCDIMIKPAGEDVLQKAVSVCRGSGIPYFILGNGSNVLFKEFRGAVILTKKLSGITAEDSKIIAAAGTTLAAVCQSALDNSLSGAESLFGIPGTVGGALYMNAGAYGSEMKDVVQSCRFIDENGELCEMTVDEMALEYRSSVFRRRDCVITSVTFALQRGDKAAIKARMDEVMEKRRSKQPLEFPSCGSTFKRPKNGFAAALIEECGLKGCSVGGAQVSEKHSGFVINKGGATFEDIIALVEHIKKTVLEQKGVELECEMIIKD